MTATLCRYLLGLGLLVAFPAKLVYGSIGSYRLVFVSHSGLATMHGMTAFVIAEGLLNLVFIAGSVWAGLIILHKVRAKFFIVFAFVVAALFYSVSLPTMLRIVGVDEIVFAPVTFYSTMLPAYALCAVTAIVLEIIVWFDLTDQGTSREAALDSTVRLHRGIALLAGLCGLFWVGITAYGIANASGSSAAVAASILTLVVGVACFASAWGIRRSKPWARRLWLFLASGFVLLSLPHPLTDRFWAVSLAVMSIVLVSSVWAFWRAAQPHAGAT